LAWGGKVKASEPDPEDTFQSCRSYLATQPFDIEQFYCQLRFSPFGADYTEERFLRTPLRKLARLLTAWKKEQEQRANYYSISTAKLAQIVLQTAHAMGGSKTPVKTSVSDFLPFVLDQKAADDDDNTRQLLSKMIKSRRIPAHVIAALSPYITPG